MFRRSMRLHLVAALGIAVAMPTLAAASASTQQATQTSLSADVQDLNGRTQATLSMSVIGADGQPATGTVALKDHGKAMAGFVLDAQGHASGTVVLAGGDHALSAVYTGDLAHLGSSSEGTPVRAVTGTTPDFSVSIAPGTLSLKQGQSGSAVVSVTPINAASLASPMFVTISCSGLPDQSKCTFTPLSIQIPIGATTAITSSLVLSTQAGSLAKAEPVVRREARGIAWAVLVPGTLLLGGFAFGARRRRFLSRMLLLGLVAFVTVLGTAACSPLYNYHNHGPTQNLPTPAGNFTVTVAAQSSNGVTATTHTTTFALTVTQ
jgi:hypothetical protein